MRFAAVFAAVSLTVASLAAAGFAATQPPQAIRDAIEPGYAERMKQVYDETDPDSPRPGPPPAKMFIRLDLNGDGIPDWRIDYGEAYNPSLFCGTGGCQTKLFVSRPGGGYVLAFERGVRELKPRKVKGEHILDLDFHGSHCGLAGVEACPRRYAWDDRLGRYVERPDKKGSGWLPQGPSPLVQTDLLAAPEAVRGQVARRETLCKAAGGRYPVEEAIFNDLPDLNGDGVRDWVVGAGYDFCQMGDSGKDSPPMPTTILASSPAGFTVAWDGEASGWGVELGAPSIFMTVEGEDCGLVAVPCKRIPWRWDGKALVRAS